jgi:hypothetical protein
MLKPDHVTTIRQYQKHVSKYEGTSATAWKPLEREFMFHKQKMEIKRENGASVTTEAQWKRQN